MYVFNEYLICWEFHKCMQFAIVLSDSEGFNDQINCKW